MSCRFALTGYIANIFSTNTFILVDLVLKTAIIFDAPGNVDKIVDYLNKNGITSVEALFFTHGHVDHIMATNDYKQKLPGPMKLYLGEKDLSIWHGMNQQIEDFGVPYRLDPLPEPDVLIKGGEVFTFGDTTIECISSPGHSQGSIVYYIKRKGEQDLVISGDVLFSNSVGRTDWSGIHILEGTGSAKVLSGSIKNLRKYPASAALLPGHGDCSTLGKALQSTTYMWE
ncbi:hypothetical protein WA171_006025 [Blastocystis sp. BT1]